MNKPLTELDNIAKQIDEQSMPPVHLWKPDYVGEIDIRIDTQGNWFHEGERIGREALVKLFASVLWCEGKHYFLVTPAEKLAIKVEDVPYIAQQVELIDQAWMVTINTGEQLIVSADHPVELRPYRDQSVPYINVRYELWARVNRSVYYEWVTQAMDRQESEEAALVLMSQGYEFEVAD